MLSPITPFALLVINHPAGPAFDRAIMRRSKLRFKKVEVRHRGNAEVGFIVPIIVKPDIQEAVKEEILKKCIKIHEAWKRSRLTIIGPDASAYWYRKDRKANLLYQGQWSTTVTPLIGYDYVIDEETNLLYSIVLARGG